MMDESLHSDLKHVILATEQSRASVLVVGSVALDCVRFTVHVAERAIALTRLEFDLLEFMARNPDRVISQAELLRSVLGRKSGEGGSLMRVHVTHLRRKLGPASGMIQTVRGRGFMLATSPSMARQDEPKRQ